MVIWMLVQKKHFTRFLGGVEMLCVRMRPWGGIYRGRKTPFKTLLTTNIHRKHLKRIVEKIQANTTIVMVLTFVTVLSYVMLLTSDELLAWGLVFIHVAQDLKNTAKNKVDYQGTAKTTMKTNQ